MTMDKKLAEIYGTNTPDDAEKLASAALAESLADTGEIDFANLDEAALEALATEVLGTSEGAAADVPVEEQQKEAQAKLDEADYLGRVMAHSYTQELRGIAKEAGVRDSAKAAFHAGKGKVMGAIHAAKGKATHFAAKGKEVGAKGKEHVMKHKGKYGLGAGAAVGAAGATAAHKMTKKSSALETLVEARAMEILAANGFEVEAPAQEKVSAANHDEALDVLGQTVEQKAIELLEANGYTFEQ